MAESNVIPLYAKRLPDIRTQANGILSYYGIKDPFKGMKLLAEVGNVQDYLDSDQHVQDYLDKVIDIARANQPAPTVSVETAKQRLGNGGPRRMGTQQTEYKKKESDMAPKKDAKPQMSALNEQEYTDLRHMLKRDYHLSESEIDQVFETALKMPYQAWLDDGKGSNMARGLLKTAAHKLEKDRIAAAPKQAALDLDGQPAAQPAPVSSQPAPAVPLVEQPKVDTKSTSPEEEPEDLANYFDSLAKAGDELAAKTAEPEQPPVTLQQAMDASNQATVEEYAKQGLTAELKSQVVLSGDVIEGEIVEQADSSPATQPDGSGQPTPPTSASSPAVAGEENGRSMPAEKVDPAVEIISAYRDTAFAKLEKKFPKASKAEIGEIHYQMTGCRTAEQVVREHGLAAGLLMIDSGIEATPDPKPEEPKEIMVVDQALATKEPPMQLAPMAVASWLNVPNREEQRTLEWYAQWAAGSGLFKDVTTTAKAMTVILLGYSLHADPNVALLNIPLVKGKPWPNAAILRSAVLTRKPNDRFDLMLENAESAKAICKRQGGEEITLRFTKEDAQKMGLWENAETAWKKAPKQMLMNRVSRMAVMQIWPDMALGMGITQETLEPETEGE